MVWLICNPCTSLQAKSLSSLYADVNPSVVIIKSLEKSISVKKPGKTVTTSGLGSGVIISRDGLVMTAAHVVQVADALSVTLIDGSVHEAVVVGSSPMADVALVRIKTPPDKLTVAMMGDSDKTKVGESIFVIGAPHGLEHTLTAGYISGRRAPKELSENLVRIEFLQTDAAINVGNSGGPMFNMSGEVIGIVSSIMSASGGFDGIGFAATINTAKKLLLEQRAFWSGLEGMLITGKMAKALNIGQEAGLLVQRVASNSPGKKIGLRGGNLPIKAGKQDVILGGDIILAVGGITVTAAVESSRKIRQMITEKDANKEIELKVLREGKLIRMKLPK